MSKLYPNINFIGMEKEDQIVAAALKKVVKVVLAKILDLWLKM